MTPDDFARKYSGLILVLPAGTRIGGRKIPANDAEKAGPAMYWSGWEPVTLAADRKLELTIDAGGLEDMAKRAARSKGRKARQGPIAFKVCR